jgi:hypothetical protein
MPRLALALALALLCLPLLAAAEGRAARAAIRDARGNQVGIALLHDARDGVCIALRLAGVEPGSKVVRLEPSRCAHATRGARVAARSRPAATAPVELARFRVAADGAGAARTTAAGFQLRDGADPLLARGALVVRDARGAQVACADLGDRYAPR